MTWHPFYKDDRNEEIRGRLAYQTLIEIVNQQIQDGSCDWRRFMQYSMVDSLASRVPASFKEFVKKKFQDRFLTNV